MNHQQEGNQFLRLLQCSNYYYYPYDIYKQRNISLLQNCTYIA